MNLKLLRKYLPKNWAEIIAERHGVAASHVRNVMVGNRNNIEIANSIIELAFAHKKKMQAIAERAAAI